MAGLRLVRPGLKYASEFTAMAEEFQKAGELRYAACIHQMREDFPAYLRSLRRLEGGQELPLGRVPQSEFWLVDLSRHRVIGTIRLRHALNAYLETAGGHIGYNIRPSERCRGYGKRMLAMLLGRLKKAGWRRVLITCNADNPASARVIEANQGYLEDQRIDPDDGKLVNRYWIVLNEG